MKFENSLAFAKQLDESDALKKFRDEFILPPHHNGDAIYFLGNSLGLQPKRTEKYINQVLKQWGRYGVEGFFTGDEPWMDLHGQLQPTLSQITGALPHEVVVMNSLTVNLHLLLVSFYQPQGKRVKILCEAKAFPSDQYMLQTHLRQRGFNTDETLIEVAPRDGETLLREEDIIAAIEEHKDDLALVFFGGVNYYTGQLFNMQVITEAARRYNIITGFDLAHAAGNVPLQLHNWGVDFASWCSYKYLNSGPGAVGGAYIHERYHNDASLNRFAGWWGNKRETQFLMKPEFEPAASAEGWQLSTPSPMLYASHLAALSIFAEAGIDAVFEKNESLNNYLHFVLNEVISHVPNGSIKILTPADNASKGCQVSMKINHGKKVFDDLTANGVFADWREPDVIRVAPVGLYNTFEEVWRFGQLLQSHLLSK